MKTIGIYPGNFQPPHRGHLNVYKRLKQMVGPEVFVATTSKTPTPEAPLHFGEKENIWVRHGVPAGHIVKVEDWKHPIEIFQRFSRSHTSVIFALNEKELESIHIRKISENNKEEWLDSLGKLNYFQPHKGNEHDMESLDKHGYVKIMDDNNIEGKPISTANIRSGLGSPKYTDDQKKKFFHWAFGWFDISLFKELSDKFKMAHTTSDTSEVPVAMPALPSLVRPVKISQPEFPVDNKEKLRNTIKEMIREILEDVLPSPSSTPSGTDPTSLDTTAADAITPQEKRLALLKKKADSEREETAMIADKKWKEADLKDKKFKLIDQRKKIDATNKAIASV